MQRIRAATKGPVVGRAFAGPSGSLLGAPGAFGSFSTALVVRRSTTGCTASSSSSLRLRRLHSPILPTALPSPPLVHLRHGGPCNYSLVSSPSSLSRLRCGELQPPGNVRSYTTPTTTTTPTIGSSSPAVAAADTAPPSTPTATTATPQKVGLGQKVMDTLRHFWAGSRLLAANVKAASMLLRKKIAGQNLTRRERRLLTQTTVDLFRLVPFLAIVVIPFAELLLPVLLAVFPNMLPSTFEDKIKKEEARRKAVQLKLEMAKFLEDALYLRSLQISHDTPSAATFAEAMKKVKEGQSLETKEILGLSKLFEDKFTLEMLDRQQVVAMCKYMGLSRFGTTHYLRNQLRSKLHDIREDDDLIAQEAALDKFTEAEMKQATQVRGMDYKDFNTAKAQMEQWLLLSAQHVPPSLLILSRAFALTSAYSSLKPLEGQQVVTKKAETGEIALPKAMEEALHKTISALPDQLVADTKLTSATKTTQDMVSKLEVLQEQIQAIKTEEKEKKEKEREEKAKAPATEAEAKQATKKDAAGAYSAEQMKVVSEAVSLLFASAPSKIKREREALEQLKERKEERKEEREEELSAASASTDQPQHQPQPPPQDKVVHTLETKLEKMIAKLDKEMDKIDQRAHTLMSIIDTNQDGQISFEEFQEAVSHLKAKYSPEDITTMWRKLDTNNDGQVSLEQLEQLYSAGADEHHER